MGLTDHAMGCNRPCYRASSNSDTESVSRQWCQVISDMATTLKKDKEEIMSTLECYYDGYRFAAQREYSTI